MAESLLNEFENSLDGLELIPSSGGVFEVTVGDELVYSKKATGRHPEPAEVLEAVRQTLS
jgi:selenoprotein W-related protein